jgi:hypothetical protein
LQLIRRLSCWTTRPGYLFLPLGCNSGKTGPGSQPIRDTIKPSKLQRLLVASPRSQPPPAVTTSCVTASPALLTSWCCCLLCSPHLWYCLLLCSPGLLVPPAAALPCAPPGGRCPTLLSSPSVFINAVAINRSGRRPNCD